MCSVEVEIEMSQNRDTTKSIKPEQQQIKTNEINSY